MSALHLHVHNLTIALALPFGISGAGPGPDPISAVDAAAAKDDEIRPDVIDLCGGKEVTPEVALKALAELGEGYDLWSPHQAFSAVSYDHKNQNGALSRDESIQPGYYWTNQPHPEYKNCRVVVGFLNGYVYGDYGVNVARARAVRVPRQ